MSYSSIALFLLTLALWLSIFIVHYKSRISEWYQNRFGAIPPSALPDDSLPEISLPFRYDPPPRDKEEDQKAPESQEDKTS
ncbi:hypothetical protein [Asaia sp. VD9]|uniref:hypothetical protein n=1 Tax=Asaia sp. VD9 TaxID=3081235 RepID=UPI003019EE3D